MDLLKAPYIFNILVLVPIALGTLFNLWNVGGPYFEESAGWRTITGSLWMAILIMSVVGLFYPLTVSPILIVQVIYKTLWLLVYFLPRLLDSTRSDELHWGIATVFLIIVATYPFVIP